MDGGPAMHHGPSDNAAPRQNTFRSFVTSALDYLQVLAKNSPGSTTAGGDDESYIEGNVSPTSPTFPGAYPSEPRAKDMGVATGCSGKPAPNPSSQSPELSHIPRPPSQNATSTLTLHGAHDFNISGNPHFLNIGNQKNVNINHYGGIHGLDLLPSFVSFDALHDSSVQDPERQCHPGTRESVLKQISSWIDNPNSTQRILWLRGPAGAGKSAIAQTIAHSYNRSKVAVATFFFFRSDARRNDGNYLFPTIAWQLAKSIPDARDRIADALTNDPDIPRKGVEHQFEYLISEPLHSVAEVMPHGQLSASVTIIDGVDECSDVKLQQRFLKVLGHSLSEKQVPLRFLISSRPEAHITDIFKQFQPSTLEIDLADVDSGYRDVEKYLKDNFAVIALKQDIDPTTWPTQDVIEQLVFKSSGHFIYASTVIKFVRDEDYDARSQLAIIQGLEPINDESPFADLDALYIEILRRQRHQEFLKEFLGIIIIRNAELKLQGKDDALLLNLDKKALHRNLRGMHSLLKIKDGANIEVHHRSFLDFLQDMTRPQQYYINEEKATRRYLELIVDALVRHASGVLVKPYYHGSDHFCPEFGPVVREYPRKIRLPLEDWGEVLRPLVRVKEESLQFPNTKSLWKRQLCDMCCTFYIIDDLLLHLAFLREISHPIPPLSECEQRHISDPVSTMMEESGAMVDDLDGSLSSLLCALRDRQRFDSMMTINSFCSVLCFGPSEVALKVRSILDAQNLIDFIHYTMNRKWARDLCGQDAARKAPLLALEIYARIPTIPRFCPDGTIVRSNGKIIEYQGKAVATWGTDGYGVDPMCQRALIWGTLAHDNIAPLLGLSEGRERFIFIYTLPENGTLRRWRQASTPSATEIQKRILEVAKVVQYLHSLHIVLLYEIRGDRVGLDCDFHAKVPLCCISLRYCNEGRRNMPTWAAETCTYESDVFTFGCLFYEIYFDIDFDNPANVSRSRKTIVKRPDKLAINENAWQLIQKCCTENPKMRPTIDQVVEEMESWRLV